MATASTLHRSLSLSVYAAAAWSFVFAALSFYWALGGTLLVRTQSPQILTRR